MTKNSKLCLVVDDSRVVRKVARRIIEDIGFKCEEAEDGQQALALCEKEVPRVIVLDWDMPVMDGIDFIRALRAKNFDPDPIVIFCTIEHRAERIQEALDAGADEYMMKPFDKDLIESKFAQVGLI